MFMNVDHLILASICTPIVQIDHSSLYPFLTHRVTIPLMISTSITVTSPVLNAELRLLND